MLAGDDAARLVELRGPPQRLPAHVVAVARGRGNALELGSGLGRTASLHVAHGQLLRDVVGIFAVRVVPSILLQHRRCAVPRRQVDQRGSRVVLGGRADLGIGDRLAEAGEVGHRCLEVAGVPRLLALLVDR